MRGFTSVLIPLVTKRDLDSQISHVRSFDVFTFRQKCTLVKLNLLNVSVASG